MPPICRDNPTRTGSKLNCPGTARYGVRTETAAMPAPTRQVPRRRSHKKTGEVQQADQAHAPIVGSGRQRSDFRGLRPESGYVAQSFQQLEPVPMERRLTAILAADVVGYSRLMGLDEAGTLAALKAHRARAHRRQDRRAPRPHRQAHRRRHAGRVPERGERGRLRRRDPARHARAQRRRAAGPAHRVPHRHQSRRRHRRGRRHLRRRRQRRGAAGRDRRARRHRRFRPRSATTSATGSTSPSRIWASRR